MPPLDTPQDQPNLLSQSESSAEFEAIEQAVFEQINQHRAEIGLSPLTLDPVIMQQARSHSQTMANNRDLSHDGFQDRADTIAQSITYRSVAENVAYNQGYSNPDERAVTSWLNSSGHRQNIEGEFNLTGIGIARNDQGEYYFTQIFILSN
ncbi:MAG: CAP domain-containing protein [Cyanobacteria bacterium CRU_2_1]|nr:CAP domain-containing protein [Cyanobacteria bacterium RU_5_0]NJR60201.1 CAP domain-containing protein [Cyanobacteria bacterium CRU_2_1]